MYVDVCPIIVEHLISIFMLLLLLFVRSHSLIYCVFYSDSYYFELNMFLFKKKKSLTEGRKRFGVVFTEALYSISIRDFHFRLEYEIELICAFVSIEIRNLLHMLIF